MKPDINAWAKKFESLRTDAPLVAQRLHKGGHVEPNSALGTQKIPPAIVVPDVYSLIPRIRLPV